ncbi:hypothetical protein BT96DRAFT_997026 [Gymnopus androsaceus JB14]|uniref:Uncharacterized protein n=1 Tax=Gymnopus androsaceus JB14 TaxID=1447944 RepID=A0A6A4HCR3_9AGAR|nr:hypothetical protein BT96DRAFT_997026 [Gymnopus androsaceus JB14]
MNHMLLYKCDGNMLSKSSLLEEALYGILNTPSLTRVTIRLCYFRNFVDLASSSLLSHAIYLKALTVDAVRFFGNTNPPTTSDLIPNLPPRSIKLDEFVASTGIECLTPWFQQESCPIEVEVTYPNTPIHSSDAVPSPMESECDQYGIIDVLFAKLVFSSLEMVNITLKGTQQIPSGLTFVEALHEKLPFLKGSDKLKQLIGLFDEKPRLASSVLELENFEEAFPDQDGVLPQVCYSTPKILLTKNILAEFDFRVQGKSYGDATQRHLQDGCWDV